MKGPHSFPVERMLAIFCRLLAGEEGGTSGDAGLQSADIFMQTSSLVSLRLLSKVAVLFIHALRSMRVDLFITSWIRLVSSLHCTTGSLAAAWPDWLEASC